MAGTTLVCPICHQPIRVPQQVPPTTLVPLGQMPGLLVPDPVEVRLPSLTPRPARFPATEGSTVHENDTAERLPLPVFYLSIVAGSVVVVLLAFIGFRQLVGNSSVRSPSAPPIAPPASARLPQPHPASRDFGNSPAVPADSWKRWIPAQLGESGVSAEFPSADFEFQAKTHNGMISERLSWPRGAISPSLIVGRIVRTDPNSQASSTEEVIRAAAGNTAGLSPRAFKVQGYNAIEIVKDDGAGPMRHVFIFTGDHEMVLMKANQWHPMSAADADRFINSVKLRKSAGLNELIPTFRWPTLPKLP
jgi:hypothetical protein